MAAPRRTGVRYRRGLITASIWEDLDLAPAMDMIAGPGDRRSPEGDWAQEV